MILKKLLNLRNQWENVFRRFELFSKVFFWVPKCLTLLFLKVSMCALADPNKVGPETFTNQIGFVFLIYIKSIKL
jgi:hypothetical protein